MPELPLQPLTHLRFLDAVHEYQDVVAEPALCRTNHFASAYRGEEGAAQGDTVFTSVTVYRVGSLAVVMVPTEESEERQHVHIDIEPIEGGGPSIVHPVIQSVPQGGSLVGREQREIERPLNESEAYGLTLDLHSIIAVMRNCYRDRLTPQTLFGNL